MARNPRSRSNFSKIFRQLTRKLSSRKLSPILLSIIFLWSMSLGLGMAVALDRPAREISFNKSVDPVTKPYQLGRELYFKNCSTCHFAIPPEVLPTETWKRILENPEKHYGTKLPKLYAPERLLIWTYLREFSRSLNSGELDPTVIARSRYFKALHPQVQFKKPISVENCISCHPGAPQFNYRTVAKKKS